MDELTLIYDGDCGFCTTSALWIKSHGGSFLISPWQAIPDLQHYGLDEADVGKAAYLVTSDQVVAKGSDAISTCLKISNFPLNLLGYFLLLPGVRQLARPIYRVIARNRHVMPGATNTCKL